MIWMIIILISFLLLLCWFLVSPLVIEVDTRVPRAGLKWVSIGSVQIWYKDEWWLNMLIFFYQKTIRLSEIKVKQKRIKSSAEKRKQKRTMKIGRMLKKIIKVMRTFRIIEWQLAIDTGDHTRNAQLYPLNFLPYAFERLHINFRGDNYLMLRIRNRPWRMLYAFLR